jgi:hypothetical protein
VLFSWMDTVSTSDGWIGLDEANPGARRDGDECLVTNAGESLRLDQACSEGSSGALHCTQGS